MPRYTSRVVWTGAEIARRRNLRGISQQQLADAIGASRRAVISWERGTAMPHSKWLHLLERELPDPGAPATEPVAPQSESSVAGDETLLRDADFAQLINALVDRHNEAVRSGLHRVLRVGDPLPPHFEEDHDVRSGPQRTSEQPTTDRGTGDRDHQTNG